MAMTGAEKQRRYRERDPNRARAVHNQWRHSPNGVVTSLLNYAKDRAFKEGVPFDLDRAAIAEKLVAGRCEMTDIAFVCKTRTGDHRAHPFAPSLDRIDKRQGYVAANVRMVICALNVLRGDWGDDVLMQIARAIVEKGLTK